MRESARVVFTICCALVLAACSEKSSDSGRDKLDRAMGDAQAWMAADAVVSELGERIGVCVLQADAESGVIEPVYSYHGDVSRPLASLTAAIDAWLFTELPEDPPLQVQIREEWCALDATTYLLNDRIGEDVNTGVLVAQAINLFDVSASSHLLHTAGRSEMELVWSQISADPRNKPLLTGAEIQRVKLAPLASIREEFERADESARRELLETKIAEHPAVAQMYEFWARPVAVESVGRFASPGEIALAMLAMDASTNDVVSGSLDLCDPVPGFDNSWSMAAGEPGVVAWVAVIDASEHTKYSVAVFAHDADEPLDTRLVSGAVGAVLTALSEVIRD